MVGWTLRHEPTTDIVSAFLLLRAAVRGSMVPAGIAVISRRALALAAYPALARPTAAGARGTYRVLGTARQRWADPAERDGRPGQRHPPPWCWRPRHGREGPFHGARLRAHRNCHREACAFTRGEERWTASVSEVR